MTDGQKKRGRQRTYVAGQFGRIGGIGVKAGEPPGERFTGEIKGKRLLDRSSILHIAELRSIYPLECVLKACTVVQRFADAAATLQITQHGFGQHVNGLSILGPLQLLLASLQVL